MSIIDKVKDASEHHNPNSREDLQRLEEFYDRMKEAGVAKTQTYKLPQPDTIGRIRSSKK
ncbi:MAG: hypothetical protein OXD39_15695 [Gemmatimonadetes bacterium]|nr:hypothetical protein [Gemmatimonadota bacterium]